MVTVQLTLKMGGSPSRRRPSTATGILLEEFPFLSLEVATTSGIVLSRSVAQPPSARLTSTALRAVTRLAWWVTARSMR